MVSAEPLASFDGQEREKGERTTVRRRTAYRRGILERQPAERSKSECQAAASNESRRDALHGR